jgi:DNA helicase-2/ATP-dependent DNA helicase PcrA
MIGDEQVGTLHSHAFRALGSPKMCVDTKSLKDWNDRVSPIYRIKGDDAEVSGLGDAILSQYNLARCRLTPRDQWPANVLEFAEKYESWKRDRGEMDYEDLIENAYRDNTTAPNCPSTILVDEAQDCTASEFRLVRRWARHAKRLIMVGDTDQAIFYFRGADPASFYATDIPEDHSKVLSQSYRVPKAVHAEALSMIRRIDDRIDVSYHPTAEDGDCTYSSFGMRYGLAPLMRQIDDRLSNGKSVMCLFACAYMAQPLCAELRGAGIPYWNRYAADRPQFNPLHPPKGVGLLQRVCDYLRPNETVYGDKSRMWTWTELLNWTDVCNASGMLIRGKKSRIEACAHEWPNDLVTADDIIDLFDPAEIDKLSNCDLDYFESRANNAKVGLLGYIKEIVRRGGFPAILEQPKLTVGTVHSCKGGEADSVFLCPDLSASGWECLGDARFRDSIYRTMYVGMTRAKNELILASPTNKMRVEW